ncbi:MAG: SHOCT domain-containing protein [Gemmatimonadota bacterium]|nr:SHOCT domain-containing protein [Gemmatimonadota bacterium]
MTFLGLLGVLLIIVLLLRLVRHFEGGGAPSRIGPRSSLVAAVLTALGAPSRIVINGNTYSSVDEMPPEVRAQYEQAMRVALDATNRDGILDFARSARARNRIAGASAPSDPATRMKQLEEMRDSGLITEDEYETKRAQILEAL